MSSDAEPGATDADQGPTRHASAYDLATELLAGRASLGAASLSTLLASLESNDVDPLAARHIALALAFRGDSSDGRAIEAISTIFGATTDRDFLAPAMLDALLVYCLRSRRARATANQLLMGIGASDSRHVLVRACRLAGRLYAASPNDDIVAQLDEWKGCPDPSVAAERLHQKGMILLADAFLARDHRQLMADLEGARTAFAQSEATDEVRPDAGILRRLLTMLVLHDSTMSNRKTMEDLSAEIATIVDEMQQFGYVSREAGALAARISTFASSMATAVVHVSRSRRWVQLTDEALHLASIYSDLWTDGSIGGQRPRLASAFADVADKVVVPALGPLLAAAISEDRFAVIQEQAVARGAPESAIRALGKLRNLAAISRVSTPIAAEERSPQHGLPQNVQAAEVAPDIHEVVTDVEFALTRNLDLKQDIVAEAVRLAGVLAGYARHVRNCAPKFARAKECGGLGATAREGDLQDDLHSWLSARVRSVQYEPEKRGSGGRPDLIATPNLIEFPIEAKAEYSSVKKEHIRKAYLSQAGQYAVEVNRVGFLVILDVSLINRDKNGMVVPLYPLVASFWVERLPASRHELVAVPGVVVVCLIPGNQLLPSSSTRYSSRTKTGTKGGQRMKGRGQQTLKQRKKVDPEG